MEELEIHHIQKRSLFENPDITKRKANSIKWISLVERPKNQVKLLVFIVLCKVNISIYVVVQD